MLGLCAVALAGCGGGGGGDNVRDPLPLAPSSPNPPANQPPPVVGTPNPAYGDHLRITGAGAAHAAGFDGKGVRIGVIDTGVMRNHPALSPRVVANLTYVPSPPNNLKVDDVVGHGTAVSQIAAGTPFGTWPGGIAPGAEIVSARILYDKDPEDDGSGQGNEIDGAIGIKPIHQDLIDRGVRVMNNSWGGLYWTDPAATAPIADEYRPFIVQNDGLVVFATGNEGRVNPSSMAALPSQVGVGGSMPAADLERGWLAVTAVNPKNMGQLDVDRYGAVYANACGVAMRYCLAAVGTVYVTGTDNGPTSPDYWRWSGTSLAAPQVSGAAALVWQAFPYFNNDLVRQTLLGTASDMGAPGVDAVFGYGVLNVANAVKGPGKFDWGDVTARIDSGTSRWGNHIAGAGGLIKEGAGTLELTGSAGYTGLTQVNAGTLRASPRGNVSVAAQGTLITGGAGGNIDNRGRVDVTADSAQVDGIYHQYDDATLAITVGNPLRVTGAVIDGGNLQVMGVRPFYTAMGRETAIVTFGGGLTGQFDALTTGPGVFLQATLEYDTQIVWLNITRLDVTATAQSLGMTAAAVSGAQRVEDAFDGIDSDQLGADAGFLTGAGAIQGSPTTAAAEHTLSSLSGELHTADTDFALMAIEGNRRALESRVDALQHAPLGGTWSDDLSSQRAVAGFDIDASGWMMGQDRRIRRVTYGAALAQTDGYAHHDLRYDRERNRQLEAQLYASYDLGAGYLLGSLALGNMQRWTQREVLLGSDAFRVRSDYAQRYATVGLQAGLPLAFGRDARMTPYAGVQSLQLERDGFSEQGAVGFGLTTADSSMRLDQALLGARWTSDWRTERATWSLQGRMEWQHLLSQSGGAIDARFTGIDVWSPIVGNLLDHNVGVFGLGLGATLRGGSRVGFDIDTRRDRGETMTRAMLNWSSAW